MNIIQALAAGFTVDEVINLLGTKYPNIGGRLKSAQKSGYDVQKFLKTLQGASQKDLQSMEERSKNSPNPLISGGYASKRSSAQTFLKEKALPAAAALGAAALGAYGASKVAPLVTQGIQGAAGGNQPPTPGPGPTPSPPIGPSPMAGAPVQPSPVPAQPQPNLATASQAQPIQQPQPAISPTSILEQMGLKERIDAIKEAGNPPEVISSVLEKLLTPGQKKWLGEQKTKSLGDLVREYLNVQTAPDQTQKSEEQKLTGEKLGESSQEIKKPGKGSIVSTPEGIVGPIKDVREKEALVESDGKLHKAKVDDLSVSPLLEKDTADLLNELNAQLEKETGEQISRAVRLVAFAPDKNLLLFIPWGGQPYAYDDLDDEERDFLQTHTQKRRTTGENQIGVWEEGTKSPFGSKMSDFIRKLQSKRGGKGNEYLAKFEYLYDPHGYAIKEQKKKYKESKKKG